MNFLIITHDKNNSYYKTLCVVIQLSVCRQLVLLCYSIRNLKKRKDKKEKENWNNPEKKAIFYSVYIFIIEISSFAYCLSIVFTLTSLIDLYEFLYISFSQIWKIFYSVLICFWFHSWSVGLFHMHTFKNVYLLKFISFSFGAYFWNFFKRLF